MGMGAAGKPIQQPTQQPQMGGGKGQPSAVKPMQSQPQPGNMGGGFAPQQPQMGTLGGGQMGTQPQMGNMGGAFAPQQGTPPAMGGGKGQPGNFSNVVSPLPAYAQPYAQALVQPQGGFGQQLADGRFANQMPQDNSQQAYRNFMASVSYAPGSTPPSYEQWSAQRQQQAMQPPPSPEMMAQANQNKLAFMNQPLGAAAAGLGGGMAQPQLTPQQMQNASQYGDAYYGQPTNSITSPTLQPLQPLQPQQALLQPQARPAPPVFLQQPVQAEAPRQAQQRAIQQMANARRGLLGGMR